MKRIKNYVDDETFMLTALTNMKVIANMTGTKYTCMTDGIGDGSPVIRMIHGLHTLSNIVYPYISKIKDLLTKSVNKSI